MRKGSRVNSWSVKDIRYLVDNAGRVPKRELCRKLKRSQASVRNKANWLRGRGVHVDLRCHVSKLAPCPACGCLSGHLGEHDGFCLPCRRQRQLDKAERDIADLLRKLPPDQREIYAESEAARHSRRDPMPKRPHLPAASKYRQDRADDWYARAMEDWKARNLQREIKAAMRRKARIKEKVQMNETLPPEQGTKED